MHTFWKESIVAALRVLSQEPAIAKVVVALNQLNAVASSQAKLVGTARNELVYTIKSAEVLGLLHLLRLSGIEGRRTHNDEGIAGPAALGVGALRHVVVLNRRSKKSAAVQRSAGECGHPRAAVTGVSSSGSSHHVW